MKVGYIRVSTEEQNTARQEVLMGQLGVERIYIDKMSGKSKSAFYRRVGKQYRTCPKKCTAFAKRMRMTAVVTLGIYNKTKEDKRRS